MDWACEHALQLQMGPKLEIGVHDIALNFLRYLAEASLKRTNTEMNSAVGGDLTLEHKRQKKEKKNIDRKAMIIWVEEQ